MNALKTFAALAGILALLVVSAFVLRDARKHGGLCMTGKIISGCKVFPAKGNPLSIPFLPPPKTSPARAQNRRTP